MVLINFSSKELTGKIVYYGPGLCGKTTNLQSIYKQLAPKIRGKFISLATDEDRTLFFDFLPVDLGSIQGMRTRFQLYTVPGQVFYNETRKLVLRGADAIVFVADSQEARFEANVESLENMKENLENNGINPDTLPLVIQYNKQDLSNILSVEELNAQLNWRNVPYFGATAIANRGVFETFKGIGRMLMLDLKKNYRLKPKLEQGLKRAALGRIRDAESEKTDIPEQKKKQKSITFDDQPTERRPYSQVENIKPEDASVALEEVVLHTHKLSWFSIDGDELKREGEDEAALKKSERPVEESDEMNDGESEESTQPHENEIIYEDNDSSGDEESSDYKVKEELGRLKEENRELKDNQQELIKLMMELKKEIRNFKKDLDS